MPRYRFQTISEDGSVEKGRANAPDRESLVRKIAREGKVIIKAREEDIASGALSGAQRIKTRDITDLISYLSITHSSGIPLIDALEDFIGKARGTKLKAVLTDVLNGITGGEKLSEAFARYEKYFGTVFVNAVRAGEETGSLDTVLDKLKHQIEWQANIKSTVKQALIYPAFLILAVIGLIVLLLTFLLPRIMSIFNESGAELPALTRYLIATSEFIKGNWYFLIGAVVMVPVTIAVLRRFEKPSVVIDRVLLRLPVFGRIITEISLARFTVIFKTMLLSGVEIVRSMELSGSASGNGYIEKLTRNAILDVQSGSRLSEAFEPFKSMNLLLPRMIAIGEKTGRIDDALDCSSRYFDESIPKRVKRMLAMLEPSIIIVAGVLVGFILLGALMPIYSMYSHM